MDSDSCRIVYPLVREVPTFVFTHHPRLITYHCHKNTPLLPPIYHFRLIRTTTLLPYHQGISVMMNWENEIMFGLNKNNNNTQAAIVAQRPGRRFSRVILVPALIGSTMVM